MLKTTVGTLRSIIKEEVSLIVESTIHTSDGKEFDGTRDKVYAALVKFGTTAMERDAILSGQVPIGSSALTYLKSQGVVKPAKKQDVQVAVRTPRAPWRTKFHVAENKLNAAIKKFAKNWKNFTIEMPDIAPEDAASDAAAGFFYEFPEWQQYARALGLSKSIVHEMVTDWVYDMMSKGAKK